jgi:hypothetical protein
MACSQTGDAVQLKAQDVSNAAGVIAKPTTTPSTSTREKTAHAARHTRGIAFTLAV